MTSWPFIAEHLNDPTVWFLVTVLLVFVVGLTIVKVAQQPYFGGRKQRGPLEEHYIHGEMTTQEYEDRKNHIVSGH
jgi:uncharacterized membrane protein